MQPGSATGGLREGNRFAEEVNELLRRTWTGPEYMVTYHQRGDRSWRWLPDFEVIHKPENRRVLVAEAKKIHPTSDERTYDSQLKRGFATLALAYLTIQKSNLLLIVDDDTEILEKYQQIFDNIHALITRKSDVPSLRTAWH